MIYFKINPSLEHLTKSTKEIPDIKIFIHQLFFQIHSKEATKIKFKGRFSQPKYLMIMINLLTHLSMMTRAQ